jgi:hypothetical protein
MAIPHAYWFSGLSCYRLERDGLGGGFILKPDRRIWIHGAETRQKKEEE